MVRQLGKLLQEINESDTDQETKEAYEHIYTSISGMYLNHLQYVERLHPTKSKPPTEPASSLPTSPTYLPENTPIVNPPRPSTPTVLSIDEDTEYAKQRCTACFDDYYGIYKEASNSAWYQQGPCYGTHFGEPANHCFC
jgi:hypothetical protein